MTEEKKIIRNEKTNECDGLDFRIALWLRTHARRCIDSPHSMHISSKEPDSTPSSSSNTRSPTCNQFSIRQNELVGSFEVNRSAGGAWLSVFGEQIQETRKVAQDCSNIPVINYKYSLVIPHATQNTKHLQTIQQIWVYFATIMMVGRHSVTHSTWNRLRRVSVGARSK